MHRFKTCATRQSFLWCPQNVNAPSSEQTLDLAGASGIYVGHVHDTRMSGFGAGLRGGSRHPRRDRRPVVGANGVYRAPDLRALDNDLSVARKMNRGLSGSQDSSAFDDHHGAAGDIDCRSQGEPTVDQGKPAVFHGVDPGQHLGFVSEGDVLVLAAVNGTPAGPPPGAGM